MRILNYGKYLYNYMDLGSARCDLKKKKKTGSCYDEIDSEFSMISVKNDE